MNTVQRIPFKQMRETIALLQGVVLPIVALLKADALNKEQLHLVAAIIITRDKTTQQLKNNPTRRQLLELCAAWRRWAERSPTLIPDGQPALNGALQKVLVATEWIKTVDTPKEVQP